jgi:hypothetical protein
LPARDWRASSACARPGPDDAGRDGFVCWLALSLLALSLLALSLLALSLLALSLLALSLPGLSVPWAGMVHLQPIQIDLHGTGPARARVHPDGETSDDAIQAGHKGMPGRRRTP